MREEDEEEGEEDRVSFTVQQENKENEYHRKAARSDSDSEPETWEKMQISKAINNQQVGIVSHFRGKVRDNLCWALAFNAQECFNFAFV